jgi:hypothetical protein
MNFLINNSSVNMDNNASFHFFHIERVGAAGQASATSLGGYHIVRH